MAIWDRFIHSHDKDEKRAKELWERAIKYYEGKLYNRALKDLQEAIDLSPEYGKEAVELMHTFSMQGNDEQALSVGYALIRMDPQNTELMNKLGNSLRKLNSFDKARRLYTQAVRLKPDYTEAKYNLAASSFRITTADQDLLRQTRKVEAFTEPRRYEFQGSRAGYCPVPNQSLEAEEDKRGHKRREEEAEEEPDEEQLAVQRERMIQELKGDLQANPGTWEAEFNLALLYDLIGYGELAIQHYRMAVEIDPEHRMSANNLAVALVVHKQELDEAESVLLKNLERHRHDRTTVLNLALLYRRRGKGFQTLKFFTYLGDLLAKSLGEFETDKVEEYAQQLFQRRKYLEAVPIFENLATETRDPFWLEKLAVMYYNQKREDLYVRTLKRLHRLDPDNEEAPAKLDELAGRYDKEAHEKLKRGSKQHAIQLLQKAVRVVETPERWVELAQLYEDVGEEILMDNAIKRWKKLTGDEEEAAPPPPEQSGQAGT